MNSESCKPGAMNLTEGSKSVVLEIRGLGHVPSFKNKKRLMRGRLITDPKIQEWMKSCAQSFASQLLSAYRTDGSGTPQECLRRFAIASVPLDDNWQELEIGRVCCKLVKSGQEGAEISIERIGNDLWQDQQ